MSLYQIITQIRNADGSNAKQEILNANQNNNLLKNFLKATYDPSISYYMKKLPELSAISVNAEFEQLDIDFILEQIAGRIVTGHAALATIGSYTSALNQEGRELMQIILDRSLGASVGDTMVLKAFPELYFIPPYQRCSLLDEKTHEHFSNLKFFYVQEKMDASFAYSQNTSERAVITRQGNKYPQWFADKINQTVPHGYVRVGEMCVYLNGKLLDRKTGNGVMTSILKGEDESEFTKYEFRHIAWDILYDHEFRAGRSKRPYSERLALLNEMYAPEDIVTNDIVTSLEEANVVTKSYTKRNKEGTVAKDPDSLWEDGTASDIIKLKVTFEADYKITGFYEGKGKAKGMLGGISIASSDDILNSNCGSGFSKKDRIHLWSIRDELVGLIITAKANDVIISKKKDAKPSLNLPIFKELRFDKIDADSYERVLAQLEAAKQGE